MKFIFHIVKAVVLLSVLFTFTGCGDEDSGLPFWLSVDGSTIDWSDPAEDGLALVSVTVFDSYGDPVDDGNVVFTLNADARGYFTDEDGVMSKSISVDIEDGDIPEAFFVATKAPETVTITAYMPGYPANGTDTKTIRVFNDTLEADFMYTVSEGNTQVYNFYDLTGYPTGDTISWSWDFDGDGTPDSTEQDPEYYYLVTGNYNVTLTVNGTSTKTYGIKVE